MRIPDDEELDLWEQVTTLILILGMIAAAAGATV